MKASTSRSSGRALPGDARVEAWRRDTPGCLRRVHLNNAGSALAPVAVTDAVRRHLELEQDLGGYEAADHAEASVHAAYAAVARLVGVAPRQVAMVENATVAFAQAVSAFDFAPGDVIVTTRNDYISNQLLFLSLKHRLGVDVQRAADLPAGGVDPDSLRALAQGPRCKLVSVTWVPTNSGLMQPVETIGRICEELGVPYLVDACQAAGQLRIEMDRLRCDFLSATARKFLRGPRGVGFLAVSERALARGAAPLYVDMRGAIWESADTYRLVPDARRFENWESAVALVLGLGAAADYALAAGLEVISDRARGLAALLRERLSPLPGVRILDRGDQLAAIVTAEVAGRPAPELVARLRARGINTHTAQREFAVIDMADKRADSALRISPHYYNTVDEIDHLVDALTDLLGTAS